MVEKFKQSQDYIDISYFIDHVDDINFRLSLIEELGYTIGTSIVTNNLGVKNIFIDKRNNIRMQVTPKYKNINIAKCVIIKPTNIFSKNVKRLSIKG